ncbi:tetratricopeptide repeat protein [Acetobacteraceae bacterium H6797]|nr:tetratricopeptide repeat protein [Acetobacteraceae bacterium H6797]
MTTFAWPRRIALLTAAMLAGCAANGAPSADSPSPGLFRRDSGTAFSHYLVGRFASAEGDTATAADNLLAALALDPNEPELIGRAFLATVMDGRSDAQRLARRMPDNQLAQFLLIGADAQAGRWDQAQTKLLALPKQGAAQILQPLMLAWVLAGRGQTDAALNTLRPLAENGRLRSLNALHAAMIADIANRPRDAERYARIAVETSNEPNLRQVQALAGIFTRAGRQVEAMKLIEELAASNDELGLIATPEARRKMLGGRAVASPVEGIAEAELALGSALRAQGVGDLSIVLARLALSLRPNFSPALLMIAEATAEDKHYDAAVALLERIPRDDLLAPVADLRRAAILDRMDKTDEAIALLQKLTEAEPAAPTPPSRLGDMLRRRMRFAEAAAAYDTAISRLGTPTNEDWPLFYARGIARERSGRWADAEADLKQALTLAPEQPYVLNYLGYTWVDQGQNLETAKQMLERAAELRPQDGNIADSVGWALYRLGDIKGAIAWLEKAVELESQNATINDHLGDAYWRAGRQLEARYQWFRALGQELEPGEGPKIEAKLRDGLTDAPPAPAPAKP